MKVLIIDDDIVSVKGILDSCDENGWEKKLSDFNEASASIMDFDPDVIVLDWREDAAKIDIGESVLEKIWNITFRPVILFTGNAAIIDIDAKQSKSNLLHIIGKGDESPVIEYLKEISLFSSELAEYRKNMSNALIESLNSIEYLKTANDLEPSSVGYILSKRTATFFDDQFMSELSPSWVQYVCPPMSSCLSVCDIIRTMPSDGKLDGLGVPEEYKLILTPSCDMYHTSGRVPKVTHVLCAGCYPKEVFHGIELTDNPSNTKIDSVRKKLNSGYNENFVPLPGFSNMLPYMTADLKKIELIPINKIALNKSELTADNTFYRVASICSPFREQIVWAHMQNSCRPGVPDRNMELWAKELLIK